MILPGWDSLDSVQDIHAKLELIAIFFFALLVVADVLEHGATKRAKLFKTSGLIFFALAVLAELVAYPYGRKTDKLSQTRIRQEEQLVAKSIEHANQAGRDAAEANERAALAESHLAEADARAEVARKDAEAFRLDIAKSNERAANAERETARLTKLAEDERLARLNIEARLASRRVSSEQAKQLCSFLDVTGKPALGIAIMSSFGTPEADDFAEDIAKALVRCGVNVALSKSVMILPVPRPLRIAFGPNRQQDAENIDTALLKSGITTQAMERIPAPDQSADALRLFVGPKSN